MQIDGGLEEGVGGGGIGMKFMKSVHKDHLIARGLSLHSSQIEIDITSNNDKI